MSLSVLADWPWALYTSLGPHRGPSFLASGPRGPESAGLSPAVKLTQTSKPHLPGFQAALKGISKKHVPAKMKSPPIEESEGPQHQKQSGWARGCGKVECFCAPGSGNERPEIGTHRIKFVLNPSGKVLVLGSLKHQREMCRVPAGIREGAEVQEEIDNLH